MVGSATSVRFARLLLCLLYLLSLAPIVARSQSLDDFNGSISQYISGLVGDNVISLTVSTTREKVTKSSVDLQTRTCRDSLLFSPVANGMFWMLPADVQAEFFQSTINYCVHVASGDGCASILEFSEPLSRGAMRKLECLGFGKYGQPTYFCQLVLIKVYAAFLDGRHLMIASSLEPFARAFEVTKHPVQVVPKWSEDLKGVVFHNNETVQYIDMFKDPEYRHFEIPVESAPFQAPSKTKFADLSNLFLEVKVAPEGKQLDFKVIRGTVQQGREFGLLLLNKFFSDREKAVLTYHDHNKSFSLRCAPALGAYKRVCLGRFMNIVDDH